MKNLSKFEMNAVKGGKSSESAYKKAYEKARTVRFMPIEDEETPL